MEQFIIKNARLINEQKVDILVKDHMIQAVEKSIENDNQIDVIELDDDTYISSGWIDAHTHCFEKFEIYADNCEEIGYKKGVAVVVDAGTAGADNIDEFYESVKDCRTHVYSLLNISKTGIYAQNELADMNHIDIDAFVKAYEKYPNFIVGVKARMSKSVVGDSGDKPLFKALEIAEASHLPLMVHIGTAPSHIDTVCQYLRPHDIITHILNPKENGIWNGQSIKPCVLEAYKKGVYFDLGHGTDSFSFDVLKHANENQIKVYSISSDIYHRNRQNGPVYDLATTMSKLYAYDYSLEEILDAVTIHPAQMLHLEKRGKIEKGYIGEFTIFKVVNKPKELIDSTGKKVVVSSYIQPVGIIINDEYICLEVKENGKCL